MGEYISVIMLLVGGAAGFGIAVFIHKTNIQNQISRLNAEWQLKIESVRAEHKELKIEASRITTVDSPTRRTPQSQRRSARPQSRNRRAARTPDSTTRTSN